MAKLLKDTTNIKIILKEHGDMLNNILSVLNNVCDKLPANNKVSATDENILPIMLPLQTREDLSSLEAALVDENLSEYLCEKLSQVGGVNLGNAIRRILTKLMTNKLATEFSWMGIKGKEAFSTLKVTRILFSAVRRNLMFTGNTDTEIETVIKDWLRHAKARCKS